MIFKFALLELKQGAFRLTSQSAPRGSEAEPHIRHLALPVPVVLLNPWGFHCACRFLFSHLSGKQPLFLPWKDCHEPHNQPGYQASSRGLLLASQVNPSSSGLPGDNQNPDMPPSGVTFQWKSWLTKPPLMAGLIAKKPYVITHSFRMPNSGGMR